jgi:hypothetical protein
MKAVRYDEILSLNDGSVSEKAGRRNLPVVFKILI